MFLAPAFRCNVMKLCRSMSKTSGSFSSLYGPAAKEKFVQRLLAAKEASGLTFDEIASRLGVTNVYCAQLFFNQAQLTANTAERLRPLVPGLSDVDLREMQRVPMRSYSNDVLQDPTVYRLFEVVAHYGLALKAVVSEKFGDGIMSAIDFNIRVDEGKDERGNTRVVVTMNGKYLPHTEQCDLTVKPKA